MSNEVSEEFRENRKDERTVTGLRTIVQFQSGVDDIWKEITNVTTVSKSGAGFCLPRPCIVGCLAKLVMPMPVEFRDYDLSKFSYPVVGIVQYCSETVINGVTAFQIGVAFIGKIIPDSYRKDPMQSYRISGDTETGLWRIAELDHPFIPRIDQQFWVFFDVSLSLIEKKKSDDHSQLGVTENIGAGGSLVACAVYRGQRRVNGKLRQCNYRKGNNKIGAILQ